MQKFLSLKVQCDFQTSEFLMAELAAADFDTFIETENGFILTTEDGQYLETE
jgi:hypothetical protein